MFEPMSKRGADSLPPLPPLPLFPLNSVLFPQGLLTLKVFEARYLDLIAGCLRDQRPFGVVAINEQATHRHARGRHERIPFESIGTRAGIIDADGARPGILNVRCRGLDRFEVRDLQRQDDGLWLATIDPIADDPELAPDVAMLDTVKGLANTIATLKTKGPVPFLQPYRFDQAGWVANRWCEILPIPLAARQQLMALSDPAIRLRLVDEFLRSKGVVS